MSKAPSKMIVLRISRECRRCRGVMAPGENCYRWVRSSKATWFFCPYCARVLKLVSIETAA